MNAGNQPPSQPPPGAPAAGIGPRIVGIVQVPSPAGAVMTNGASPSPPVTRTISSSHNPSTTAHGGGRAERRPSDDLTFSAMLQMNGAMRGDENEENEDEKSLPPAVARSPNAQTISHRQWNGDEAEVLTSGSSTIDAIGSCLGSSSSSKIAILKQQIISGGSNHVRTEAAVLVQAANESTVGGSAAATTVRNINVVKVSTTKVLSMNSGAGTIAAIPGSPSPTAQLPRPQSNDADADAMGLRVDIPPLAGPNVPPMMMIDRGFLKPSPMSAPTSSTGGRSRTGTPSSTHSPSPSDRKRKLSSDSRGSAKSAPDDDDDLQVNHATVKRQRRSSANSNSNSATGSESAAGGVEKSRKGQKEANAVANDQQQQHGFGAVNNDDHDDDDADGLEMMLGIMKNDNAGINKNFFIIFGFIF